MAGSDQKTQIAQEVPPEVARLINRPASGAAPAAPPEQGGQARTVMAQAPVLPQQAPPQPVTAAPPAAAARTMMAQAPSLGALPQQAPPGAGAPPSVGGPLPQTVAPGGFAQGLPPPPAPPGGAPPGAAPTVGGGAFPGAGTASAGASPTSTPGAARVNPNPLPLRPASSVFGNAAAAATGPSPVLVRWAGGPAVALLAAVLTALLSNRLWPPATGSGGRGPDILAAKSRIQIITTPAGATVVVNGEPLSDKTPTYVEGAIGKKAQVKITLAGFEPREVVVPFTKEDRPPLRLTLFRPGQGPIKEKTQDSDLYDDRPGTKTAPDPDDEPKQAAAPEPKDDKAKAPVGKDGKDGKASKVAAEDEGEGEDEKAKGPKDEAEAAPPPEEGKRGKRGRRGKGKATVAAADKDEAADKGDKADKPAVPKGKALLTVLVRPWAIVYVDNRKIKQTPVRDLALSPGKHTVLLQNDNKGKREVVPVSLTAGGTETINRNWE